MKLLLDTHIILWSLADDPQLPTAARDLIEDEETFGRTVLPKSENIKLMVKRNGLDDAVYVGDTRQDETSAREAGVRFIYASYGFGEALEPDETIASPKELPKALERMGF